MVRRSVEIHLLRHVAERKLENRDTCVYIHAAIGRNTAELVRSGLSIKKKREKERERERERERGGDGKNVDDWKLTSVLVGDRRACAAAAAERRDLRASG